MVHALPHSATTDRQDSFKPTNIRSGLPAHNLTGCRGKWIIWSPSKFCLPLPCLPPLCPPSMREQRWVFSGREQAQRPILRRGQTCLCSVSFSHFMGKKKLWVESHRSDSKKLYLWYHLFSSPADGRRGFRKSRSGRDKGGGVFRKLTGGGGGLHWGPLWLSSAGPSSCRWVQRAWTITDWAGHLCGRSSQGPQKDLELASPMSQSWLLCSRRTHAVSILFQDTQAVKPQAHVIPQQLIGTVWNHQKSLQPLLWIRISSLEVISIMADKVGPLELNHMFL